MSEFMNSTRSGRYNIITTDRDEYHIYELLSKHYRLPISELKSKFSIELNVLKKCIEFTGSNQDIYDLYQYLSRWGLKFESITMTILRVSLQEFINKIL